MPFTVRGCSGPVQYRTRNQEIASSTHTQSTASNLEQVANLYCILRPTTNSASNPQRDGKWVVATATGWRLSVADICLTFNFELLVFLGEENIS